LLPIHRQENGEGFAIGIPMNQIYVLSLSRVFRDVWLYKQVYPLEVFEVFHGTSVHATK
jgi:hypothetical protein